jgi:hypothetical protein
MKIKASSKKVPTPFPRRIALLGYALLALTIFAPTVGEAVPITLSLDNPNQFVAAPLSGTTIVHFSGTVIVDPNFHIGAFPGEFPGALFLDVPSNSQSTLSLTATFTSQFLAFAFPLGGAPTGPLPAQSLTSVCPQEHHRIFMDGLLIDSGPTGGFHQGCE